MTTPQPYQYLHPAAIIETCSGTESDGTQLLFACPMCGNKASFSMVERVGRCFACTGIIKLHTKYDPLPVEELFHDLTARFPIATSAIHDGNTRVEIVTRPLSQASLAYITSRDIDLQVVQRFGLLAETSYRDGIYLAWKTYAGDYELRATFTATLSKMTPQGHQKHFTVVKFVPEPTTCIVCEGLFSAMAYAQLFQRYDVWYVILNSTSNWRKLIEERSVLTLAGIREVILALDNDPAGQETASVLAQHLQEAGLHVSQHLPDHDGKDWNDALLLSMPDAHGTARRGEPPQEVVADHGVRHDDSESYIHVEVERAASLPCHDGPSTPHRDTVESLSRADQTMTADYYDRVLTTFPKAAIAAPCGLGKTLAAAESIARRWQDGVLYVAERTEQLQAMQQLLTTRHGVPAEVIGTYYASSADLKALCTSEIYKPIALITQARMQIYSPQTYVMFHRHGKLQYRQLMIVDESLPALVIMTVPMLVVEALLHRMDLTWGDTGALKPDDIDTRIHTIDSVLDTHAAQSLHRVGIQYLEWTNYLTTNATSIGIRRHAYYLMLYQILSGKYLRRDNAVDVLIPMAPHMTWMKLFEYILTLDATAHITDYLYTDYPILTPGTWNYQDIVEGYTVYSSIGNLTKTNTAKHRETFLAELHDYVAPLLAERAFDDPYVVTYKTLNGTSFVDDVKTVLGVSQVQNYGGTRGSNAYRTKASAVLLGSYRPPVEFDQLASLLFGARYSPYKYAVAHWVQELYRTQIRNRTGETIKLLIAGEEDVVKAFKASTQLRLFPMVTSRHDHPDWVERTLKRLTSQAQQTLYRELIMTRKVSVRSFADRHTDRSTHKAWRALRGLLQTAPELNGHIQTDQDTIFLVDKPAPMR